MTTTDEKLAPRPSPTVRPARGVPVWVSALLPLVLLAALLAVFAFGNPLALFRAHLPPVEDERLGSLEDPAAAIRPRAPR